MHIYIYTKTLVPPAIDLYTCTISYLHVFFFSWRNLLHVTLSFTLSHYKTHPPSSSSPSMASKASLLLAFLLLFSVCLARHQQQQNQCQIRNIDALEPYDSIQAEGGVTEFWDAGNEQFQCAGVEFIRHRIQPGGLLLPSYVNTPLLAFVENGRGVQGVILPGCPETYETSSEQENSGERERRGQNIQDRHQKVENLKEGDVIAIPAGAAHWVHNDGDKELVIVVFFDTQNEDNQLDQNHRRFFLAGNPQDIGQQQGGGRRQPGRQEQEGDRRQPSRQEQEGDRRQPGRQEQEGDRRQPGRQEHEGGHRQPPHRQEHGGGRHEDQPHRNSGNIFNGFDVEFLSEAFNVDRETAEKLQGQQDQRGHIINVGKDLQIIRPRRSRQEQQEQGGRGRGHGGSNGFEETICSLKLKENVNKPTKADFVNPEAGLITNLNNYKFPILRQLQLSAERGELHRNAIQSPRWTLNAHSLVYVTDGSMRVQIVNDEGESVFDDELRQGQVVVIPQNFAAIKRGGEQGARWIAFRTNDNAITANLAGRMSAIRSMPVDVVANAYQLSRDDAQRLKFSQRQTVLFKPTSSSRSPRVASA